MIFKKVTLNFLSRLWPYHHNMQKYDHEQYVTSRSDMSQWVLRMSLDKDKNTYE